MGVTQVVQVQCDNCGRVEVGGPDGLNDIGPGWVFLDHRTGERIPDEEIDADGGGWLDLCLCPECAGKVQYDPASGDFVPLPSARTVVIQNHGAVAGSGPATVVIRTDGDS